MILRQILHKRFWALGAVAAVLVIVVVFSTQAFSSGLTATSEPLQNTGAKGALKFDQDWSGASTVVITRHESSVIGLDWNDRVSSVTVKGAKLSGSVEVTVYILDASQGILDTQTVALDTVAGGYDQLVPLTRATAKLAGVARVLATYRSTVPTVQSIVLKLTDVWDSGRKRHSPGAGTFKLIEYSDNRWLPLLNSFWATFQFETLVPVGATIVSTKVYVEHWESNGFKEGDFIWEIGIGSLSEPTVLGSTIATNLNGRSKEAIVEWDVTPWIFASTEANDLKLKVINNSSSEEKGGKNDEDDGEDDDDKENGMKVNLDHIYVIVEYIQ